MFPNFPPIGTKEFADQFSLFMASIVEHVQAQNPDCKDLGRKLALMSLCKIGDKDCSFLYGAGENLMQGAGVIAERMVSATVQNSPDGSRQEVMQAVLSRIVSNAMNFKMDHMEWDHTSVIP